MGWIFRKSVKILPGLKLNFGKKGTSVTLGSKGGKVTFGKGRTTFSSGIPGTGLYYRETISKKKIEQARVKENPQESQPIRSKAANNFWGYIFIILGLCILVAAFYVSLKPVGRFVVGALGVLTILASFIYFNAESSDCD